MNDFKWRPASEVPQRPTSALFATFDDIDLDSTEPYLLDGIFNTSKGRWVREDGGPMPKNIDAIWWIDEEALFAAWPLQRPEAA